MRHFDHIAPATRRALFHRQPGEFTTESPARTLSVALGATLYSPATRPGLAADVLKRARLGVVSMVLCLEDSIRDEDVPAAENNLVRQFAHLATAHDAGATLPLLFMRVRTPEQIPDLVRRLGGTRRLLSGFVLPKFTEERGVPFLEALESVAGPATAQDAGRPGTAEAPPPGERLFAMPVLESPELLHLESRAQTLGGIARTLEKYRRRILALRLGVTDFCSAYGLRRAPDMTAYDVQLVASVIADVVNVLGRADGTGFTVTGPVWEYFRRQERMFKPQLRRSPFHGHAEELRDALIEHDIDGLLREIELDRANGLQGKTCIHPTHVLPVHALSVVSHEEYSDAADILRPERCGGGVLRSAYTNKMNEVKPHRAWAERIMARAEVFGVAREGVGFVELLEAGVAAEAAVEAGGAAESGVAGVSSAPAAGAARPAGGGTVDDGTADSGTAHDGSGETGEMTEDDGSTAPWSGAWVTDRLGVRLRGDPGLHDLLGLALRHNPRRAHLLVSHVLGKHVPQHPHRVHEAGTRLGRRVRALLGEREAARAVVLGYAETATALGHSVADGLALAPYLHSTRRPVPGVAPVGGFEEEHSHATSHLLLPEDPELLSGDGPLVLVDDEFSTGRTVLNTLADLHARHPRNRYVVVALVDMRSEADRRQLEDAAARMGARVDVVALATGTVDLPPDVLARGQALVAAHAEGPATVDPGAAQPPAPEPAPRTAAGTSGPGSPAHRVALDWPAGVPDGGRHGFSPEHRRALDAALPDMAARLAGRLSGTERRVLVLGNEELMYAPLRLAEALETELARWPQPAAVYFSTTTRSPVLALDEPGYAIRTRLEFPAHDDPADGPGPRYAYNVAPGREASRRFDTVVAVVDSHGDTPALHAEGGLLHRLRPHTDRLLLAAVPAHAPAGSRATAAPRQAAPDPLPRPRRGTPPGPDAAPAPDAAPGTAKP